VQGALEQAIGVMTGHPVRVRGASRTDAGVHALGQRVAFDSERDIAPIGFLRGLNGTLDDDVAIVAAEACEPGFAPRFAAAHKTYRYLLHLGEARDPLWRGRAWHLGPRLALPHADRTDGWLDVDRMREAAARLVGTHDFAALRAADDERTETTRTILGIDVRAGAHEEPALVAIEVTGTAFLKNMVRILAGTLVEVGRGQLTPEDVAALVRPGARRDDAGPTAPAHGLCLVEIVLAAH
jgi:tRNA pseudouridine38-40 synthase